MDSRQKSIKVAIAQPHYDGPDVDCYAAFNYFFSYLGRLSERSIFRSRLPKDVYDSLDLPPLSSFPLAELTDEDPEIRFYSIEESGWSLPHQARERCVQEAIHADCDYVFFYDHDMRFDPDILLRLLRRRKDIVFALAFTSREPILPVVYRFSTQENKAQGHIDVNSDWWEDYPRNTLFQCSAHGAGICLISTEAFKKIGKIGWFNSEGAGEDIAFCLRAHKKGIPIYCDSTIETGHKPKEPPYWHDQKAYDMSQQIIKRIEHYNLRRIISENFDI